MVVGGVKSVIVKGISASDKHRAFHQLDGDIGFHVDAAREVATHPEAKRTAALFRNPVDGELDATGVHSHAVTADAEFRGVVGWFWLLREGLRAHQQGETEDDEVVFHFVVLFGPKLHCVCIGLMFQDFDLK